MPSKEYFRNLAQMSRRIARNMTDRAVAERLEAIGAEYDQQADEALDTDSPEAWARSEQRPQGSNDRA